MRVERGRILLQKTEDGTFCAMVKGAPGHIHGTGSAVEAVTQLAAGQGVTISGDRGLLPPGTIRYAKDGPLWIVFRKGLGEGAVSSVARVGRGDLLPALCESLDILLTKQKPLDEAKIKEEFVKAWQPPPTLTIEIKGVGGNGWKASAPKLPVWFVFPFNKTRPDYRVRTDFLEVSRLQREAGVCVAMCDDGRGLLISDLETARLSPYEASLMVPEYVARVAALRKRRKSK